MHGDILYQHRGIKSMADLGTLLKTEALDEISIPVEYGQGSWERCKLHPVESGAKSKPPTISVNY